MKIIIIGPAYPFRGGIATFNERLALEFQNQGHNVKVHTFTLQYPSFLFPGKTQFVDGPAPNNLNIIQSINSVNPLNWITVGNKLKAENADLVIVRFWLPFMGPSLGTILRKIKKNKKSKIVCVVDNIIPHEARIGDRLFTNYFVKPVGSFLAMSQNVFEDIDQFSSKKPKILSPHPVFDNFGEIASREEALDRLNLPKDYKYLLFFGLIRDYKGLDLLLEALGDIRFKKRKIKLIIAGEYYADREKYDEIILKFNLKNQIIQIDKFIPDAMVPDLFNACDLVVQPYKNATQSGVTQVAYHFNKPMVVTDVGGLKEMCPNGKVGYVVQRDPAEISQAIFKFFDETDLDQMRENIVQEKKRFSWEKFTQNIFKIMS